MSELSKEEYEALLAPLSIELSEMARWVAETGQRLVVLFEGRDTAGKGGTIDSSPAPSTRASARQWRCPRRPSASRANGISSAMSRICPAKGEIVLFDRSWYNRAGVEKVMGYCTEQQVEAFLGRCRRSSASRRATASCCSNIG